MNFDFMLFMGIVLAGF